MSYLTRISTVTGSVRVQDLGNVLTHEHISMDFTQFYTTPPSALKEDLDEDIQLRTVGYVRQHPYSCEKNLKLDRNSIDAIVRDLKKFKEAGGGTIVENSSIGLNRDIDLVQEVSRKSGVPVIVGTGFYVAESQISSVLNMTVEQMYNHMHGELLDTETIRNGFIGEVGSTWPIEEFEKRSIIATGQILDQLRTPVTFHPGRNKQAPMEVMRLFTEAGGSSKNAIMSHLDRTLTDHESLMEFVDEFPCFLQFDLFGTECSYYQLNTEIDMLSDAQRIKLIHELKEEKKLHHVLMSQDIHTRHRLTSFGGHGYAHILINVIPKMRLRGFNAEDINLITKLNPRRWLSTEGV